LNNKLKDDNIDYLFKTILKIQTLEECYNFFEDVSTINEMKSLSQRLQVARMLTENKTYTEIETETGASTATISRVNRCLNYGEDGYKVMIERMKQDS
jgi:TrpR-related protein YerC/YecD